MRLVVAITGASGAAYGVRTLTLAAEQGAHLDLVVSDWGRTTLREECGLEYDPSLPGGGLLADEVPSLVTCHPVWDMASPLASGSSDWQAMVVVPCSLGTLGRIAAGTSDNLIVRAATVALKERRPLVLVPRETPLGLIEIENMARLARAGAVVLPAMPAFYRHPATVTELVDFIARRVLAQVGLVPQGVWKEPSPG